MRFLISLSILLILFSVNVKSEVSVGVTPGFGVCDYTTIQAALDSGDPMIKIVNDNEFEENLFIDHNVVLWGGFETCDISGQAPFGNTANSIIKGSSLVGSAVISINSASFFNIRIYNLTLKDATDTIFISNGGHGIRVDDSVGNLILTHTSIFNNTAEDGAGIFLGETSKVGNLVVTLEDSSIFGNTASNKGGGIYCSSTKNNVWIYKESWVGENTAANGGGIAAVNGCNIKLDSGVDVFNSNNLRGVTGNIASQHGGGLYLNNSGLIQLLGNSHGTIGLGDSTSPVTVANNTAGLDGAGIYAINGSDIVITDALISNNNASRNGGGMYLSMDSTVVMDSAQGQCWQPGKCSVIAMNKSGLNNFGGGVYLDGNSSADIQHTFIYGNRAGYGTGIYVSDTNSSGSSLFSDGNYFYKNGLNGNGHLDNFVIRGNGNVDITLYHNTITNNDINDNRAVVGIINGVNLTIKNTILHNSGETLLENTTTNVLDVFCLAVHETSSISGGLVSILAPDFVDIANDDYHLGLNSDMIDRCLIVGGTSLNDTDNDNRGYDDPNHSHGGLGFLRDIGADESLSADIIYQNGFE